MRDGDMKFKNSVETELELLEAFISESDFSLNEFAATVFKKRYSRRLCAKIELYIDGETIFEDRKECAKFTVCVDGKPPKELWASPIICLNGNCRGFDDYRAYLIGEGWEIDTKNSGVRRKHGI